jgi:AraC-like DNA-binding protein
VAEPLIQYREILPPAPLARWVEAFCFIHTVAPSPGQAEHWVLPDASLNLVFWAPQGWSQTTVRVPPIVSGPSLKEYRRPAIPGESYVIVRFLPGAGATMVGSKAGKLTAVIQPLQMLQPSWAEQLTASLREVNNEADALAAVQQSLLDRTTHLPAADTLMIEAAAWHRRQRGPLSLHKWCSRFGLSERQFRRRFLEAVGLSPRAFARVVRMQAFARQHLLQPKVDWAPLSYRAGFSDQAHFINEFRSLSGGSPRHFHRHLQNIDHGMLSDQSQADGRNFQDPPAVAR